MRNPIFAMVAVAALSGCGGDQDTSGALTKDDVRGGKGDSGVDWCERLGWYGDGVCDDFCQNPDPDCDDAQCQPVLCELFCENGFDTDENGCEVCRCREECQPVLCQLFCEYGFATNEDGCEVCSCREPTCEELGGTCESSPADVGFGAQCEEELDKTTVTGTCPAINQSCCHACFGAWADESGNCRAPNDGMYPPECCPVEDTRTPASGACIRNSNDACTSDAECVAGGCGGELCYNPDLGGGVSTCECISPAAVSCGCVNGSCTWWR